MIELPNTGRDLLPTICKQSGYKKGAEIGVWQGEFSELFLKEGLEMYCVDAWEPYKGYYDFQRKHTLDGAYEEAKKRLNKYPGCKIIKAFSAEAAAQVQDGELDFVYIDANHTYEGITSDLALWVPKVRRGGMVAGHDWDPLRSHNEVQRGLTEFIATHGISPVLILGRTEKRKEEIRDLTRSWFWIVR